MDLGTICAAMSEMETALFQHRQAYDSFRFLSERHHFEDAAKASLAASAALEASMDAYTRAMQIQYLLGGYDDAEF